MLLLIRKNRQGRTGEITLFTLHFATINTEYNQDMLNSRNKFTLHFATINTIDFDIIDKYYDKFTLHFATINTLSTKI